MPKLRSVPLHWCWRLTLKITCMSSYKAHWAPPHHVVISKLTAPLSLTILRYKPEGRQGTQAMLAMQQGLQASGMAIISIQLGTPMDDPALCRTLQHRCIAVGAVRTLAAWLLTQTAWHVGAAAHMTRVALTAAAAAHDRAGLAPVAGVQTGTVPGQARGVRAITELHTVDRTLRQNNDGILLLSTTCYGSAAHSAKAVSSNLIRLAKDRYSASVHVARTCAHQWHRCSAGDSVSSRSVDGATAAGQSSWHQLNAELLRNGFPPASLTVCSCIPGLAQTLNAAMLKNAGQCDSIGDETVMTRSAVCLNMSGTQTELKLNKTLSLQLRRSWTIRGSSSRRCPPSKVCWAGCSTSTRAAARCWRSCSLPRSWPESSGRPSGHPCACCSGACARLTLPHACGAAAWNPIVLDFAPVGLHDLLDTTCPARSIRIVWLPSCAGLDRAHLASCVAIAVLP